MKALTNIQPEKRSGAESFFNNVVVGVRKVPGLRSFLLFPLFTRPGYWFATACAFLYGTVLRGRFQTKNTMRYFTRMPKWAFGRGGTTIGGIYLTIDNDSDDVITHEAEHREQWKRYGLWFIPLYIAAGESALTNRFEVAADLVLGGYVRRREPR